MDLAGEHAPPSLRPEISVEEVFGDAAHGSSLDDRSKSGVDVFEHRDIRVIKSVRPVGRPGHDGEASKAAVQRERKIIGRTGLSELRQQRIFGGVLGEGAPKWCAALSRRADRTVQILPRGFAAAQDPVFLDDLELAQPACAEAADLWV